MGNKKAGIIPGRRRVIGSSVVVVVFGVSMWQREGSLARSAEVFGTWTGPPGKLVGVPFACTDSSSAEFSVVR
jgi:hypothetical protein